MVHKFSSCHQGLGHWALNTSSKRGVSIGILSNSTQQWFQTNADRQSNPREKAEQESKWTSKCHQGPMKLSLFTSTRWQCMEVLEKRLSWLQSYNILEVRKVCAKHSWFWWHQLYFVSSRRISLTLRSHIEQQLIGFLLQSVHVVITTKLSCIASRLQQHQSNHCLAVCHSPLSHSAMTKKLNIFHLHPPPLLWEKGKVGALQHDFHAKLWHLVINV